MDYIVNNEVKHFDINSYKAWGGAEDFIKNVEEADMLDELQITIENAFEEYGEPVSDSQINAFLWWDLQDYDQWSIFY